MCHSFAEKAEGAWHKNGTPGQTKLVQSDDAPPRTLHVDSNQSSTDNGLLWPGDSGTFALWVGRRVICNGIPRQRVGRLCGRGTAAETANPGTVSRQGSRDRLYGRSVRGRGGPRQRERGRALHAHETVHGGGCGTLHLFPARDQADAGGKGTAGGGAQQGAAVGASARRWLRRRGRFRAPPLPVKLRGSVASVKPGPGLRQRFP